MLPIEFPQMNHTYGKPKGMTDEQCAPLHVYKGNDAEKNPVIISCWQLSKEDLEYINKTGKVYLIIHGTGMPPVNIIAEDVFPAQQVETFEF